MKDQYFGDEHDYRKYTLLRIFLKAGLTLGVCWMLTENDQGKDGNRIKYLHDPDKFRNLDPDLFDFLRLVVIDEGKRKVCAIEKNKKILPKAIYFSKKLYDCSCEVNARKKARSKYSNEMIKKIGGQDLIFFDPDNGMEIESQEGGNRRSPKHLYWEELERTYYGKHCSVIIYQHFPMFIKNAEKGHFIKQKIAKIKMALNLKRQSPIYSFSTSDVVFLLVSQSDQKIKRKMEKAFKKACISRMKNQEIWGGEIPFKKHK